MKPIFQNSHIRTNILTGEEVLVSPQRNKRPWQGNEEKKLESKTLKYDPNCYLCPGNSRANGIQNPSYEDTFIFVNDYAALNLEGNKNEINSNLLQVRTEQGICKVVCFSPNHSMTLSKMNITGIQKVIHLWQNEFRELSELEMINNIQIFENKGAIMGCSNPHPHGQIWAQETVPIEIRKKTMNFEKHFRKNHKTLLTSYYELELKEQERIIFSNEHFIVLVPFWAIWPFETMIIPKRVMKNISEMNTAETLAYADAIKQITNTYDKVFKTPFPYSSGIHQSPCNKQDNHGWHWHMSFYPPLLRSETVKKFMVGYEMFGMPQRDITPENAAELLKSLI